MDNLLIGVIEFYSVSLLDYFPSNLQNQRTSINPFIKILNDTLESYLRLCSVAVCYRLILLMVINLSHNLSYISKYRQEKEERTGI